MSLAVRVADPVTTEAVSPLTKPVMVSVKLGSGWPKAARCVGGDGEGGRGDGDVGGGGLSG